jgi:hypothetical protein
MSSRLQSTIFPLLAFMMGKSPRNNNEISGFVDQVLRRQVLSGQGLLPHGFAT